MKNVFSKDLYRFYGEAGESLLRRLLRPRELKYIALFRRGQSTRFRPVANMVQMTPACTTATPGTILLNGGDLSLLITPPT